MKLFAHKFQFVVYSSLPKLPKPSIYIRHRQTITLAGLVDNCRMIFPTAVNCRLLFSFDLLGSKCNAVQLILCSAVQCSAGNLSVDKSIPAGGKHEVPEPTNKQRHNTGPTVTALHCSALPCTVQFSQVFGTLLVRVSLHYSALYCTVQMCLNCKNVVF